MVKRLPKTVVALGLVSLFTDVSSEMIYPLLPVFLTTVLAASPWALGLIEGIAESTASILKIASGLLSDRLRRRKPLVVAGYGLASAVRPLIGLTSSWLGVLLFRFLDRVGKGLRTSPRDVLIAEATPADLRGQAYGLQRALDHAGAILGPLTAAVLLTAFEASLRQVFLLAAVPGAVAVAVLVLGVKEHPRACLQSTPEGRTHAEPAQARRLGRGYSMLLVAVVVFTLGNSTDAFILLRLHDAGVPPAWTAMLWSALHVVKTAAAYVGGRISDRTGRRPMMFAGWLVYAAVYVGFATVETTSTMVAFFLAYGLFFGLTEPVERAWISEIVPHHVRGRAFGLYHGAVGLAALPASVVFGLLWQWYGAETAFLVGAVLAGVAALLLLGVPRGRDEC